MYCIYARTSQCLSVCLLIVMIVCIYFPPLIYFSLHVPLNNSSETTISVDTSGSLTGGKLNKLDTSFTSKRIFYYLLLRLASCSGAAVSALAMWDVKVQVQLFCISKLIIKITCHVRSHYLSPCLPRSRGTIPSNFTPSSSPSVVIPYSLTIPCTPVEGLLNGVKIVRYVTNFGTFLEKS